MIRNVWKQEISERPCVIDRQTLTNVYAAISTLPLLAFYYFKADALPILAAISHRATNIIRGLWPTVLFPICTVALRRAKHLFSTFTAQLPRLPVDGCLALCAWQNDWEFISRMVSPKASANTGSVLSLRVKVDTC